MIFNQRDNIGQKHKIPATLTTFTAISSQIQAERANFTSLLDTEYKNVVDESGKEEFPGITAKNVRVMARKIDLNNRWNNTNEKKWKVIFLSRNVMSINALLF